MNKIRVSIAAFVALWGASVAHAQIAETVPWIIGPEDRALYRRAFQLVDSGKHAEALKVVQSAKSDVLAASIEGDALLAGKSASFDTLAEWLERNADLPQAAKIRARALSIKPEGVDLPRLPARVDIPVSTKPRQRTGREAPADDRESAKRFADRIKPLLDAEQIPAAESAWSKLSETFQNAPGARAHWASRIGWYYYLEGNDLAAARVSSYGGSDAVAEAATAHWVAGLAFWRLNDCENASRHFDAMMTKPDLKPDLRSAGLFWAARAHFVCGRPERISRLLREAARAPESFYGLLAIRILGFTPDFEWGPPGFINADWNLLAHIPGVKRAVALARIGQLGRADQEMKHLWGLIDPTTYDALVRLAAALNLPSTQNWLSQRPPVGHTPPISTRYPAPEWVPYGGWRVERPLVYAFALKESNFQTNAVSKAGARGLMQLMPSTTKEMQKSEALQGVSISLEDPVFNLEAGQAYLERLRDSAITGGVLPKVIAAYNAGPGSVKKWNDTLRDNNDPLLFIESIPFWETRDYVEKVMRNYWMYQLRSHVATPSLDALANGLWPRFPGLAGPEAVKTPVYVSSQPDSAMPAIDSEPVSVGLPPAPTPVPGGPLDPNTKEPR